MKNIRDMIMSRELIERYDPERIVEHVSMGQNTENKPHRLETLVLAKDFSCPRCGCKEGYAVPDSNYKNWWSCLKNECIIINGNPNMHLKADKIPLNRLFSLRHLKVPIEYETSNLGHCTQPFKIIQKLMEIAKNPNKYFLLYGSTGSGKTYSAIACLDKYLELGGKSCRFAKCADIFYEWKSEYRDLEIIEKYSEPEFLVLDDLMPFVPSESYSQILYLILDRRKSQGKGTILTTNLSSENIKKLYGEAIASRILSGELVPIVGADRRQKNK